MVLKLQSKSMLKDINDRLETKTKNKQHNKQAIGRQNTFRFHILAFNSSRNVWHCYL